VARELELKMLVTDPAALRVAFGAAGASRRYRGRMDDRRLDRGNELSARDQVLRVRRWMPEPPGTAHAELAWKGEQQQTHEGLKLREELEFGVADPLAAFRLFERLGYQVVHVIDRFVEIWILAGTTLRLEWYPRMDVLLEIEGTAGGIERAIATLGLDRAACTTERLSAFVSRYAARTGQLPLLDESGLGDAVPSWAGA